MNGAVAFDIAIIGCALLLLGAMAIAGVRIARGPHVADRVVALDMLSLLGIAAAGLAAVATGSAAFVDVALGVAFVGFLAIVAFSGFMERGSRPRGEES